MSKPTDFDFYCEEALSGKTPINTVYESDTVLAFHHTKPVYEFHLVIIPKEHIQDLTKLEERHNEILIEIVKVAKQIAKDFNFDTEGVRLITNMGTFQDTPHLHFHVVSGKSLQKK